MAEHTPGCEPIAPTHNAQPDTHRFIGEDWNGEYVAYEEFEKRFPAFAEFLADLNRWRCSKKTVLPILQRDQYAAQFPEGTRQKVVDDRICVYLFTAEHSYQISARLPTMGDPRGYLGCIARRRKPRAGSRIGGGSDLPDGPFSRDTWEAIKNDMLAYELEPLEVL